jgi:hypothetical protein
MLLEYPMRSDDLLPEAAASPDARVMACDS